MTDIALGPDNDLLIVDGQIPLLVTTQEFTKQRLGITLGTISGEWFLDIDFGVPRDLLYAKGTKGMMDSEIIRIIQGTVGITSLNTFDSSLDKRTRVYTVDFTATTDSGEILAIEGLEIK